MATPNLQAKRPIYNNTIDRRVSNLTEYEKSRLLHHLLQKRDWDGKNGRPWDEYLHNHAEQEIQMLICR